MPFDALNKKTRPRILVMCGDEAAAKTVANVLASSLPDCELRFVEENVLSFGRALSFTRKRLLNKGLLSLLGCYCFYLLQFARGEKHVQRLYVPEAKTSSLSRSAAVRSLLAEFRPDLIVIAFCGVLSASFLHTAPCPVINIHPGVNPRYRGFGNIWAWYENRPELTGYTIHEVDEGIDTGRRIAAAPLDFGDTPFEEIDVLAADVAARHLVRLIKQEERPAVHKAFAELPSAFYGVPTLRQYIHAKRNYARRQGRVRTP